MSKKTSTISYQEWYSAENLASYPNLNRLLSQNRGRNRHLLMEILSLIQHDTSYAHGILSERYFNERTGLSPAAANKTINFFCVLLILTKAKQRRKGEAVDDPRLAITYKLARRSQNALRRSEERAAIMLRNKLSRSAMS